MVDATASERPAVTHWSRFCAKRLWTVGPEGPPGRVRRGVEPDRQRRGLRRADPRHGCVFAGDLRGREQRRAHVKLGLPAPEIVERSLSKVALLELAAQAGIPAPETAVCTEPDAVLEAARRFGYPVMLKSGDVVFERDGELRRLGSAVVHDEPSLRRLLREYGDSWLVQRVEPGTLLSFAGVMAGGRLLAPAVSRYRRTWPPEAGSVAFSETIEPPPGLSEKVHALVAAMGWEGIFELELLEAAGGSPSTLDMNPRVYGSLALADRAGAPLPAVWCDWLLQRKLATGAAQPGYRYRWDDAEIRRFGWLVRNGDVRSIPELARPHFRTVRAHLWRSDPLPFAARVVALLRHRGIRLRKSRGLPRAAPAVIATPHVSGQVEVAIVGAGPYGLSSTAFLRDAGVGVHVFGEPMGYWRDHMPRGMLLRSRWRSSHIADPARSLTLEGFEQDRGVQFPEHVPVEGFIDYGLWFQQHVAPDIDQRRVERIARSNGGFQLELDDGDALRAKRVVVAAGLHGFAHRPAPLSALPAEFVSHSSDHVEFAGFRGRRVLVVGAGQSALESAGLLCEAGAEVEVLVRSPSVLWLRQDRQPATAREYAGELSRPPTDVGGRLGWVAAAPDVYRAGAAALADGGYRALPAPASGTVAEAASRRCDVHARPPHRGGRHGGKRRPGPAGRRERAVSGSHRARDRLPDRCWVVSLPVRATRFEAGSRRRIPTTRPGPRVERAGASLHRCPGVAQLRPDHAVRGRHLVCGSSAHGASGRQAVAQASSFLQASLAFRWRRAPSREAVDSGREHEARPRRQGSPATERRRARSSPH